jgi:predicted metalloprotease with PDZ domain
LGFKILPKGKNAIVQSIYSGSPSDIGGLSVGDEIFAVNGKQLNSDLDKWLFYLGSNSIQLTIFRNGLLKEIQLKESHELFYPVYEVKTKKIVSQNQLENLKCWGADGIS